MMAGEGATRVRRPHLLTRIALPDVPDGPAPVQLIAAQHPVAHKQRAVGRDSQPDRAKILAPLNEWLPLRRDRGTVRTLDVALDPVIGPRGHEQVAEVLGRQTIGFIAE